MTERWRRGLGELDGAEPESGLWERIVADDTPRPPLPHGARRVGVIVLALAVAAAGTGLGWRLFNASDERLTNPRREGYVITFSDQVTTAADNPNGGVVVDLSTNLPDGTRFMESSVVLGPTAESPQQGGGSSCCSPVAGGHFSIGVGNQSCLNPVGTVGNSSGFTLTVTVRPSYDFGEGGLIGPGPAPSPSPDQPDSVRTVLGERFERMNGPQVTVDGDVHQIVVSRTYAWPADSCRGVEANFIPGTCPATRAQAQGTNLGDAVESFTSAIYQERLCELWDQVLTQDAEARHPYPSFKAELDRWIHSLGDLGPNPAEQQTLAWHELSSSGNRHHVEISLHGTPVAELVVLALPDYPGSQEPGIVPFWGVDDYTLIPGGG